MMAKSLQPADINAMLEQASQPGMGDHPVIRTLYDHVDEVTCVDFHPTEQVTQTRCVFLNLADLQACVVFLQK